MAISKIEAASIGYAGAVLQVVSATYNTQVSTTTNTYIDTGLTATITPKFATSKVLVIVTLNGVAKDAANAVNAISLRLLKNGTNISLFGIQYGYTASTAFNLIGSSSTQYLDSPATTSATTYKTQFYNNNNVAGAYVQLDSGCTSVITVMEIAA